MYCTTLKDTKDKEKTEKVFQTRGEWHDGSMQYISLDRLWSVKSEGVQDQTEALSMLFPDFGAWWWFDKNALATEKCNEICRGDRKSYLQLLKQFWKRLMTVGINVTCEKTRVEEVIWTVGKCRWGEELELFVLYLKLFYKF